MQIGLMCKKNGRERVCQRKEKKERIESNYYNTSL